MITSILMAALLTAPAVLAQDAYTLTKDIVYSNPGGYENKLDLYRPRSAPNPSPVVVYIHGGGWITGTKDTALPNIAPYLEMGWTAISVDYRLAKVALAPAAVEDCLCALRWVVRNAKAYNLDVRRIVLTGRSAGGHLALTTALLPADSGFARQCPGPEPLKVAAVINWFGITDVQDVLSGANQKKYAVEWLGSLPNKEQLARAASPLHLVRAGLCPILTIHGDADPTVPYSQAVSFHSALDRRNIPNRLISIAGGKHGGFSKSEMADLYHQVGDFLARHVKP